MEWQMSDAKNKLSEVVTRALTEGPQTITRRGEEVIVLSMSEYQKLRNARRTARKPVETSFGEWLLAIPRIDDLDLSRDQSPPRNISL